LKKKKSISGIDKILHDMSFINYVGSK